MEWATGRRGFCAAVVAGSTAGCIGVLGREREQVTALRRSAGAEWSREVELDGGDDVIVEYDPSGSDPSRMVVEDPQGVVVFDQTISDRGTLRYTASVPGTHTLGFEWGASARIDLYRES